jgi:hypothetical protein
MPDSARMLPTEGELFGGGELVLLGFEAEGRWALAPINRVIGG